MSFLSGFGLLRPTERLFYEFAGPLLEQGLNSVSIIRAARGAGLGIRNQVGLSLIRHARGVQVSRAYISSVGVNRNLDFARLPYSLKPLNFRYRYTVKFGGFNRTTGENQTMYRIFQTDTIHTKASGVSVAAELLLSSPAGRYYEIHSATMVQTERNIALYGAV